MFSTTKAVAALLIARLVDAGKLDYDQPVADDLAGVRPGRQGRDHRRAGDEPPGGPLGLPDEMEPGPVVRLGRDLRQAGGDGPLWPPGTASGYHPITFGYMAGEIFRRVDGRTMGTALREDLARAVRSGPLDRPARRRARPRRRPAAAQRPAALRRDQRGDHGRVPHPMVRRPAGRGEAEWRRMEIPSANGHATARGLARLMGALAGDGWLDGESRSCRRR